MNLDQLLTWGQVNGRDFPWRHTANRFELAVAEVLLQRTKGADVLPIWLAVLSRYSGPRDLAGADAGDIYELVSGLGLGHQRTERLLRMATDLDMEAPVIAGIGTYGAGVIALAEGRDPQVAPVDANIARVAQRFTGLAFLRGEPRKKPEIREIVSQLLARVSSDRRIALLYALVDLGERICVSNKPGCQECPLFDDCAFAASRSSMNN